MKVEIQDCNDPKLLASLNEEVQTLHHKMYPALFKPFNYSEILSFYEAQLMDPNWKAFLLVLDQKAIGYALVFVKNYTENAFKKAYSVLVLDQLCVLNKHKGKGFGKRLMNHVEAYAASSGIDRIELDHWEANKPAGLFFKNCGFVNYRLHMTKDLLITLPE